jgi:CBS domain containing-hemolysin-like protein
MDISKVFIYVVLCITLFTLFLHAWVTKDDIQNLPDDPKERLPTLFYFSTVTISSIGYGDVYPKSVRARMAVTVFIIFAYVASIVGFMTLIQKGIPSA